MMMEVVCRRQKRGESLTLTRLITGLWRCPSIDVNMWSRDCHATDALELYMNESSTKKASGCASNSLAHEDLGHFEEAHHWNIQAKFYNERLPLVYESDNIGDSVYEKHGATLTHKCGKRIVTLSLLSFSLIFLFGPSFFFFGLFSFFFYFFIFRSESHPDLWGNHSLLHPFLTGAML